MINKQDLREIEKITKEFFQKMTFDVGIELLPQKEQTLPIKIKTEDPQILIGDRGQTLMDIQRLLKAILKRKIVTRSEPRPEEQEEIFYIDLDINDYKKKKNEYLRELARSVADEVTLTKKERILSSMSAYERRVIHLELSGRSDVVSESIGEEPERRVVIKPQP